MDVKPWDDETDMKELEKAVRKVATDGLLWGACKLIIFIYLFICIHIDQSQLLRIFLSSESIHTYFILL